MRWLKQVLGDWFVLENNVVQWDESTWRTICHSAQVISLHAKLGPKVIQLNTSEYIKVFNAKPGLSKRRWFPKYQIFVDNAFYLKKLGFRTIEVTCIYHLPHINAHAVRYNTLPGDDFRHMFRSDTKMGIELLINFLVLLHQAGIYFHGMHLGNVLYDKKEGFGIIDMADLSFHTTPLRIDLRVRHLKRLLSYHQDHAYFASLGLESILSLYLERAALSPFSQRLFRLFWKWLGCSTLR